MIHDLVQLDRPLVCLDFETTGIYHTVDRIVQIGLLKLYPDGELNEWETLIDPGVPIPKEASDVHHITDTMVNDAPDFADIAKILYKGLEGCDLAGYNVKAFDVKFLVEEFKRCGITYTPPRMIDAFLIFKQYHKRNLTAAVKTYLNEDLPDAHSAMADAKATFRILRAQLLHHTDLPRTIAELDALFNQKNADWIDSEGKFVWKNGQVMITFGKYKGIQLKACRDIQYFQYILTSNFPDDVKVIVRNALGGKYPTR